jgi:hypothetical protein
MLAAAVCKVLEDRALNDALRQSAKGLRLRYSVDAMVDDYVRILQDACGRSLAGPEGSPS